MEICLKCGTSNRASDGKCRECRNARSRMRRLESPELVRSIERERRNRYLATIEGRENLRAYMRGYKRRERAAILELNKH